MILYRGKVAAGKSVESLINNNTDRPLYVLFSRFSGFTFTISLRQKPKGVRTDSLSVL